MIQTSLEDALRSVEANMNKDWGKIAMAKVKALSEQYNEFTADDLWEEMNKTLAKTPEPRALGAIMMKAKRMGWIEKTDRVRPTKRKEAHSRPIAVWRSTLCQNDTLEPCELLKALIPPPSEPKPLTKEEQEEKSKALRDFFGLSPES